VQASLLKLRLKPTGQAAVASGAAAAAAALREPKTVASKAKSWRPGMQ